MTTTFDDIAAMRARVGTDLGTSSWHDVTQARIDAFAAATDDFEDIHVDPESGRRAGLGGTIAHGLYTLSLGPKFLYEIYAVHGYSLALNYGYDKVRWLAPVPAGSRVRMTARLTTVDDLPGGTRFGLAQTFELEGSERPACIANSVIAYFD